jgi:hypothetical protein
LAGYYTIFDNDDHANAKMGFAPHANSSKVKVEKITKPTTDIMDILWEITWLGMTANPSAGLSYLTKVWSNTILFFLREELYGYPTA